MLGLRNRCLKILLGWSVSPTFFPARRRPRRHLGTFPSPRVLGIPILLVSLPIQRRIRRHQTVLRPLRLPRAINRIRQSVTEPSINVIPRSLRKPLESRIHIGNRRIPRRQQPQNRRNHTLIVLILIRSRLRRIQILLKSRLKNSVVIHIPIFPVPSHHLRPRIK